MVRVLVKHEGHDEEESAWEVAENAPGYEWQFLVLAAGASALDQTEEHLIFIKLVDAHLFHRLENL